MVFDLTLMIEKPTSLRNYSTFEEMKDYEKWDRPNRMSLMIMKRNIHRTFRVLYLKR